MKTKSQIKSYLKNIKPRLEIDGLAIRQYCSDCGIDIPAYNLLPKDSLQSAITFEDFKNWVGGNSPSTGEVIVLDTEAGIGLVLGSGYETITFHALISPSGELQQPNIILARAAYRPSVDSERTRLQKALSVQHLDYNKRKDVLIEKLIPSDGKYVRVTLLGQKIGIGIFQRIDAGGNIVMYVFQSAKDESLLLHKNIGAITDYQLELASNQERETVNEILEHSGYIWNGYSKHVQPKALGRPKGTQYFYINCFHEIVSATETNAKQDTNRFHALNYYAQRDDALEVLASLVVNHQAERNKMGRAYYFIDNYLSISETIDKRRPSDTKRFKVGNYFANRSCAERYLQDYMDIRKMKLLDNPSTHLKSNSKKGRKSKN